MAKRRSKKPIRYEIAPDIKEKLMEIIDVLEFYHIKKPYVEAVRSYHSKSDAIARCHAFGKIFQVAFGMFPRYVIEVVSERFDKLPEDEKIKVLIHELMHIPKNFGGGFRNHDYVCDENVEKFYKIYVERKRRRLVEELKEKYS